MIDEMVIKIMLAFPMEKFMYHCIQIMITNIILLEKTAVGITHNVQWCWIGSLIENVIPIYLFN